MFEWWNKSPHIPSGNKNFQKIVNFYLFQCPVLVPKTRKKNKTKERVSKRGITFEDKKWIGSALHVLRAAMFQNFKYIKIDDIGSVQQTAEDCEKNSSLSDPHFEMAVFYDSLQLGIVKSIFYDIRNAFAHGSFSVLQTAHGNMYYFESYSQTSGNIISRIRLKESTLLNWIELFHGGLKKQKQLSKRKHQNKGTQFDQSA